MLKKYQVICFIVIAFVSIQTFAYSGQDDSVKRKPKSSKTAVASLQKDLDDLVNSSQLSDALIGISIESLDKGEVLYKLNENKNFIPASTRKLITTAAALEYLGPEFKFTTKLYLKGYITETGEFVGDLIVRGAGDPTLSDFFYEDPTTIFEDWADKLDSLGIKSIIGNIIGDDNYFDDVYYGPGWAWDDMNYPFSAQVDALSFYDNKADILMIPKHKVGEIPDYKVEPANKYIQVINHVKTINSKVGADIKVFKDNNSNTVELFGDLSIDSVRKEKTKVSVTIDNPTLYFLDIFKECLEKNRIKFKGSLVDIDDWKGGDINYPQLNLVASFSSPPLKDIIYIMNRFSDNIVAESLLKTIAKEQTGSGSFQSGADILSKFSSKAGMTADRALFADGSGLSRFNLNSPAQQTKLLSYVAKKDYKNYFVHSLPTPNEEGSLKRRMLNTKAEKSLQAKTGSMNGVSCLAGYIRTADGENLAFSIMINNFTEPSNLAKNLEDMICMRLSSFSRKSE